MEEESPKKSKKKKIASWPLLIVIVLVITIVILLGWFFTRGTTTTTGSNPEIESVDSIVCEANNVAYPFFTYDNSTNKSTKISVTFTNDKLNSISFIHILYYDDAQEIKKSEAINHAALNTETQDAGIGPDIFNAHYSISSNSMKLTLGTNAKEITNTSAKYLMLNDLSDSKYTKTIVQKNYKSKGFSCKEVNK